MASRYETKPIVYNATDQHRSVLEKKQKPFINQYPTPTLKTLTVKQTKLLHVSNHMWILGDRFYKLAYEHYGDSEYWWIIAWFNQTPTEHHVGFGDIIRIPKPLDRVLQLYEI
tara:strand:+ start:133 stop:471 length:339 start_codon:yes stop_codon:yes gene_type:complete